MFACLKEKSKNQLNRCFVPNSGEGEGGKWKRYAGRGLMLRSLYELLTGNDQYNDTRVFDIDQILQGRAFEWLTFHYIFIVSELTFSLQLKGLNAFNV